MTSTWIGWRRVPLFADLDRHELEVDRLARDGGRPWTTVASWLARAMPPARRSWCSTARLGRDRDGEEIATFGPGDFFGEMALLVHGHRTATVTATSALSVRVFHKTEFDELLERLPKVAVKILRTTAERLLDAEDSAHH